MNLYSQRIIVAIALVVLAAVGLIWQNAAENGVAAGLLLLTGLTAIGLTLSADGAKKEGFEAIRRALKELRSGKEPELPVGVSPEVVRVFDEIERLVETIQSGGSRSDLEQLRAEKAKLLLDQDALRLELERVRSAPVPALSNKRELEEAARLVVTSMKKLTDEVAEQANLSERAGSLIKEMATALIDISEQVEVLAKSAEESSSSMIEMTATSDEMAENIGELGLSVRETVTSIEEMTFSIKEVAKNVDALSLTAEETSSSMNEMDVSIDQVQSNANETARLSEEVAHDAEQGAESILKTIGEIYRIKESSQEAVAVISNLGSRIDAIGQILNVIDEVAEQTNLLALNAAIIAAQAGEHGKGFAVVADEIKDLAERAGASTKEIADLIKTIQSEGRNAIQAVERGAQNVDRGVQVSSEAERALKKILESSQKSTNMVRAIASATVEQAKGSKQVTDAIGRIAETVQQIATATAEQARGSELIMSSSEKMRTISQQVERSSQEQARGGRQITQAIGNISVLVHQLSVAHRQHANNSDQALTMATNIEEVTRKQSGTLRELAESNDRIRSLLS
jgi:methyl-accepting chemotaxis protein